MGIHTGKLPETLPVEETDSTNLSTAGNGDLPMQEVAETSVIQPVNGTSLAKLKCGPKLHFSCGKRISKVLKKC